MLILQAVSPLHTLALETCHPSWHEAIEKGLSRMDPDYLKQITKEENICPKIQCLFNAFTLSLNKTAVILFGESPYPRTQSANGFAFWDGAVQDIWSPQGFSKAVNRATSLRNWLKLCLVSEKKLAQDTSQIAIAALDKSPFIQTLNEFFEKLIQGGFLLLNASLVFSPNRPVKIDAKAWQPFMESILKTCADQKREISCLLLGKIAEKIENFDGAHRLKHIKAEHPYNISFIHNPLMIDFFQPLHLLNKKVSS